MPSDGGFTYVEVLMSIAILSILAGGLFLLANGALRGTERASSVARETAELIRLEHRLREAASNIHLSYWLADDSGWVSTAASGEAAGAPAESELSVRGEEGESPLLSVAAASGSVTVSTGEGRSSFGPFTAAAVSRMDAGSGVAGVRVHLTLRGEQTAVIEAPFGGQPDAFWE